MFPADERRVTSSISSPKVEELRGFGGRLALVDDRGAEPVLGGNKARKLLLGGLLEGARERGAARLFTVGAVGSHHVLATAVLGARAGFEVHAALWSQPDTPHVRAVFEAGTRAGLVAHRVHSARDAAALRRALREARSPRTAYVPLGGSTPATLEAHARAARDVAQSLGGFDAVVVPLGSGGTAAGIALGLEAALGRRGPSVHGVAVSPPGFASPALALGLLSRAAARGLVPPALALGAWRRLHADDGFLAGGYGHTSPAVDRAIDLGAREGLTLEPTYTGKAFAAAVALAARGARVAFWMTLGRVPGAPTCP
jgi:D-cysteine desulfhydrase